MNLCGWPNHGGARWSTLLEMTVLMNPQWTAGVAGARSSVDRDAIEAFMSLSRVSARHH
jgi:hypothetical protein